MAPFGRLPDGATNGTLQMHIRLYTPTDLPTLIALKRDTIRRVNCRDYSAEQIAAWVPDDSAFTTWPQRMAGRFVVVAEIDGQLAGFGDVSPAGHIDQFYVSADHQRRGVGAAIMAALLAEARRAGMTRVYSEVSITARPFFEAQRFVVDAEQTVVAPGVAFVNCRMSRRTYA